MLTSCSPEGGERGTEEDGRGGEVWQVNCECLEIIAAGVDPGFSEGGGGANGNAWRMAVQREGCH